MDYKPFTPLSEENIDGHMLFGMMGKNCRTTIINGRVLYKDREFVGIDEEKINAWTMAGVQEALEHAQQSHLLIHK